MSRHLLLFETHERPQANGVGRWLRPTTVIPPKQPVTRTLWSLHRLIERQVTHPSPVHSPGPPRRTAHSMSCNRDRDNA
jgi:hypothetical protein